MSEISFLRLVDPLFPRPKIIPLNRRAISFGVVPDKDKVWISMEIGDVDTEGKDPNELDYVIEIDMRTKIIWVVDLDNSYSSKPIPEPRFGPKDRNPAAYRNWRARIKEMATTTALHFRWPSTKRIDKESQKSALQLIRSY